LSDISNALERAQIGSTENPVARTGLAFARFSERWFPDPFVFALLSVIAVFALAIAAGENMQVVASEAGRSFWILAPFTMQMVMVVISGYVVASAAVVSRCIAKLARMPKTARGAVAFIALFAILTSLLSWGLSLVFSGYLVREMARCRSDLDYPSASAAAYLGLGVTWALGLSSSAAMLMATESSLPPSLAHVAGVIPLSDTLFTWQNGVMILVMTVAAVGIASMSVPRFPKTAAAMGVVLDPIPNVEEKLETPAARLGRSPALCILVSALLIWHLAERIYSAPRGFLVLLDLNTYNLIFIVAGLLLHWRPTDFLRAVGASVPAAGGVLIQFPFYAMVFGMIVNTGLSEKISKAFVLISSPDTYALVVAAYSAVLGLFIPSGGSKWIIEAPYVLHGALVNHMNVGWTVQIYNAAEALPNLINPFWMLPLLAIVKCRASDLVGYGMLQVLVLVPLCFFMCWTLGRTF
jgi:short-chain fatty acids transporter